MTTFVIATQYYEDSRLSVAANHDELLSEEIMAYMGRTFLIVGTLCFALIATGCGKEEKKSGSSGPDERTKEAIENIDKILKHASVYYSTPMVADTGMKLPCQFPASFKSTPATTCCSSGGADKDGDNQCDKNLAKWDEVTWSSLEFQMNDSHYYVYEVKSSGTLKDAKIEVFAYGDLDCDGEMSTFKRTMTSKSAPNPHECAAAPGKLEKINPDE